VVLIELAICGKIKLDFHSWCRLLLIVIMLPSREKIRLARLDQKIGHGIVALF
jgi:hypothetical protein